MAKRLEPVLLVLRLYLRPVQAGPIVKGETMSDCFLYFRLWRGFTDPFPVDRFNGIANDQDLAQELDDYARGELARPEIRLHVKQVASTRRKNLLAGIKRQSALRSPAGFRTASVRKRLTKRDWYWPRIRHADRRDPLVCRLGAYLDWWQKRWNESLPFGPRVWFYRMSSQELAEAFVSHLNERTDLEYDGHEMEYYLRPRFGFVENSDTALQITAMRSVNAIRRGKNLDIRAGKSALAMGQKAMGIADEMQEALAPAEPTQPAPVRSALKELSGNGDQAGQTQPETPPVRGGQDAEKTDPNENSLERCKPSERKAYYSFKLAEAKEGRRLEDRKAWDLLHENDWSENFTEELTDYQFPASFGTWARQLRAARKATGERKYTPRTLK